MTSTITDRLNGVATSVANKVPAHVATTANINLFGLQTIDGVVLTSGKRVLVKDQTNQTENGIYTSLPGDWTRTTDFDGSFDAVGGTLVYVNAGTTQSANYFRVAGDGPVNIGTDNIVWEVATGLKGDPGDGIESYATKASLPAPTKGASGVVTDDGFNNGIAYVDDGLEWKLHLGQPVGFKLDTSGTVPVSVPYYTGFTDIIIFIGQSNAEGRANDFSASPATTAFKIVGSTISNPLADPVNGTHGSAMPAWANEWQSGSQNRVAIVEAATGATGLLVGADTGAGNWSSSGALRAAAVTAANDAIAAVKADSTHKLGSVHFVWWQGENDANAVNGTTVTGDLHKAELKVLADYLAANVPEMQNMFVVRLGDKNDNSDQTKFAEIRAAQEAAATEHNRIRVVYRGLTAYPADAQALHQDASHFLQEGYNKVGTAAAREALKNTPTSVPAAPAILGQEAFIDTATSTKASKTDSHTCAAMTKKLVVGVTAIKTGSSSSSITSGVTYGGVAMTQIVADAGSTNTPADSRVDASLWELSEADYGSSLSGATANIVVTQPGNVNNLSSFAYDVGGDPFTEAIPFADRTGAGIGTTYDAGYNSAPGVGLTTGAPVSVIGLAGTVGAGAAKLTHAWTGLTEDFDDGGTTGTRAAQASSAQGSLGEVTEQAISVTTSGDTGGVLLVLALRTRLDGE